VSGSEIFIQGLIEKQVDAVVEGEMVCFEVIPVSGHYAFEAVKCGVALSELAAWPTAPPHWLHMSSAINFERTNTQQSSVSGWIGHSRPPANWGRDRDPIAGFLSHCRSVVGEAT
jgi:hypothetical protein